MFNFRSFKTALFQIYWIYEIKLINVSIIEMPEKNGLSLPLSRIGDGFIKGGLCKISPKTSPLVGYFREDTIHFVILSNDTWERTVPKPE